MGDETPPPPRPPLPASDPTQHRSRPPPPPTSRQSIKAKKPTATFYIEKPPDVPPLPKSESTTPTQKKLVKVRSHKGPPGRKAPERPPPTRKPPEKPESVGLPRPPPVSPPSSLNEVPHQPDVGPPRPVPPKVEPTPPRPAPPRAEMSPPRPPLPSDGVSVKSRSQSFGHKSTPPREETIGPREIPRSFSVRQPAKKASPVPTIHLSCSSPTPLVSEGRSQMQRGPSPQSDKSDEVIVSDEKSSPGGSPRASPKSARKSMIRRVKERLLRQGPGRQAFSDSTPGDEGDESPEGSLPPDTEGGKSEKKHKFFGGFSIKRKKKEDFKMPPRSATHAALPITKGRSSSSGNEDDGALCRLVAQCLGYLNKPHILKEEGLFRISGNVSQINQLSAAFIAGQDVDLSEVRDPNTVAGLLKQHFRNSRKPLVALGPPQKAIMVAVRQNDAKGVKAVLSDMPIEKFASLQIMIEILTKVAEHSEENRMNSSNLGLSCGMSLFKNMSATTSADLVRYLIDNRDRVFF
eukprot:m.41489 g.41489  ORF g.41489 m.41489 type:complete len:519 (+) comp33188_c0_seq2:272-1828(+)